MSDRKPFDHKVGPKAVHRTLTARQREGVRQVDAYTQSDDYAKSMIGQINVKQRNEETAKFYAATK